MKESQASPSYCAGNAFIQMHTLPVSANEHFLKNIEGVYSLAWGPKNTQQPCSVVCRVTTEQP